MRVVYFALIAAALAVVVTAPYALGQSYKWADQWLPTEPVFAPPADAPSMAPLSYGAISRVATTQIPLPVPVDPNDMLMQDAYDRSDFGSGFGFASAFDAGDPIAVFRLVPNVKLDGTYDTGNPAANLSPSTFALDGSAAARASGKFAMKTSTANLKTDLQLPDISTQLFMEIQTVQDEATLDFRQIYGRVGNLLGGEYYSSFTDNGTLPQSIVSNAAPAGAVANPKVAQLQFARLFASGLLVGVAIENPNASDFTLVTPTDTRLQRVPDFVGRIRYQPLDAWGSLQAAILLRDFGYEEVSTVERFTSVAVSFSSNARFKIWGDDNVRLGVVGGQGAGARIFGLTAAQVAAGPEGGNLVPLQNVGTFASYQHFWLEELWSNVAYGYAFADVTETMVDATRIAHNGWVNLIWNNASGKVALGVEYQFGQQEVGDGRLGINHHIQLSLQVGKGYITPPTAGAATPVYGANAAEAEVFPRL